MNATPQPASATARARLATVGVLACCALALLSAHGSTAEAAPLSSQSNATYTTDGAVLSVARAGDTIYLGGYFDWVGPRTGPWAAISPTNGQPDMSMPHVSGSYGALAAAAPDGKGGWYIAGDFTRVDGLPRHNLAHILPDNTVDQDWVADSDYFVDTLAVGPDGTVYVGGFFEHINGEPRHRLAALNPTTGRATSWDPNPNRGVGAIAFAQDGTVYVGGAFTVIGANHASRTYIAALDPQTGDALAWNPSATPQPANSNLSTVGALVIGPDGTVYAGGYFNTIGANHAPHSNLAAIDPTTGNAKPWSPNPDSWVGDLVRAPDGTIYAAGNFATIGANAAPRHYVAALDPTTAEATAWNPDPDDWITRIARGPDGTIYLSGPFKTIGANDAERHYLAALDPQTGNTTPWDPHADGSAGVLAFGPDGMLYAGGSFGSIGAQPRHNLAALDASDGSVKSWAPKPNGAVTAITRGGDGKVYVGGEFTKIGPSQSSRRALAALDSQSGEATSWNPNPNYSVNALLEANGVVYAGGIFTTIGANGAPRSGLAALDAAGNATAWNPNPQIDLVNLPSVSALALVPGGNSLYVGGTFKTIGGQPRSNIAAIDRTTGLADDWSPNARKSDGSLTAVTSLAVGPPPSHTVYAGGGFNTIGANNAARHNLAALDPDSGGALAWNPNPTSPTEDFTVYALAAAPDGTVYAGGLFETIGANRAARLAIAALDPATGNATGFDPGSPSADFDTVQSLAVAPDGTLYVGGWFRSLEYANQVGYASFGPATSPVNTTVPHINGTPKVGESLTCTSGIWTGGQPQTYAYEWRRDGSPIPGASTSSYTAVDADGGHSLSCQVTATNVAGSASIETTSVSIPQREATGTGGGGDPSPAPGSGSGGDAGTANGDTAAGGGASGDSSVSGGGPTTRSPLTTLALGGRDLVMGRDGRVALRLRCRGRGVCRGVVRLLSRPSKRLGRTAGPAAATATRLMVLARARFSIRAGSARTLRVRLRPNGVRLVRARRQLRVLLEARPPSDRATVTLRRPLTLRTSPYLEGTRVRSVGGLAS